MARRWLTLSSWTWLAICHMRVSLSSFMPYGPISSARARSSLMSENSSALNGIAPSAVRLMNALWFIEKQMFPALTLRNSTSEYLVQEWHGHCKHRLWQLGLCKWLDNQLCISSWGSEFFVSSKKLNIVSQIPYRSHNYAHQLWTQGTHHCV